jgi:hypothetical protein
VAVGRQARRRRQIAKYGVLATHSLRVVPRHVTCRSFDTASKEVVTPDFHQLEPDGELAKPAPGAPRSRIVKRAGVYESLPAEWGSVFGAGEPVAEHCGVFRTDACCSAAGLLPVCGLKPATTTRWAEAPALRRGYSILSATHGSTPAALRAG